jgi:uncharacterized protein (TIGR01777 family)
VKFLLAGSSGFLGTALRVQLAAEGHEVLRLVRREPATATERRWRPDDRSVDPSVFAGVDVVVNLAGAGVADRLWSEPRRRLILSSRVNTTATLATALAELAGQGEDEATPALIQASGISRYGTGWSESPADEESPAGSDYLSQVVVQWEAAAQPAVDAGVRVVFLRTSPVMDAGGGPLQLMKLPWSLGLGARLGDGRQRMPMISLHDYLRVLMWTARNNATNGAYNVTIPQTTTNAEFSRTLAEILHRPQLLAVPGFVLRTALGELAEQLLGDMYVLPRRLVAEGFLFDGTDVEATLRSALDRSDVGPAPGPDLHSAP